MFCTKSHCRLNFWVTNNWIKGNDSEMCSVHQKQTYRRTHSSSDWLGWEYAIQATSSQYSTSDVQRIHESLTTITSSRHDSSFPFALVVECGIMSKEKWQVKNVHRHLNERTIKDSYALPRSEEILDSLDGNHYYTVLEKKYGYHQVEVEESHKQRTVFTVGPLGFYDFDRLSFGFVNSPATYQRLMQEVLAYRHLLHWLKRPDHLLQNIRRTCR